MSTQTIDFNNVDSVVFDDSPVDILKLNGTQIWEGARWFNFTGIDASGNYEGTTAYDGTPVEYGIGKPRISYTTTTDDDGNETVTENISWDYANGLSADYYEAKYGEGCLKSWDEGRGATRKTQVVEDILVIPSSHNGLPVTKILEEAFYGYGDEGVGDTSYDAYQPWYYKKVVFGNNIKEIHTRAFYGLMLDTALSLPSTLEKMYATALKCYSVIVEVNSDITAITSKNTSGLYDNCKTVVFNSNVTKVNHPVSVGGIRLVFKHSNSDTLEISYNSTGKNAVTVDIYTDNDYIKNYDWSTNGNVTPTFYSLSEWDGT